jgi:hypothetical protein
MRTAGRCLVVGGLLAALVVLGMDGRLPAFLAWSRSARCWCSGSTRWSASSSHPPTTAGRGCRSATGSPMTRRAAGCGGGRGRTGRLDGRVVTGAHVLAPQPAR